MCYVTPREAKRLAIKDKIADLLGEQSPLGDLLQDFLALDEEAQKTTPQLSWPYVPVYPMFPTYPYWYTPWPTYQHWNIPGPYKITITANTSTGHYPVETTTTSL